MELNAAIRAVRQRKYAREKQAAIYGISADPVIGIELENLTVALNALEVVKQEFLTTGAVNAELFDYATEVCVEVGIFTIELQERE